MNSDGGLPVPNRGEEVKRVLEAGRSGLPFLLYRDARKVLCVRELSGDRMMVGRTRACDLEVNWDPQLSRVHAEFRRIGDQWTVIDEGLSRNGTFVGGERLIGRRRLRDGDTLRLGQTLFIYRSPGDPGSFDATQTAAGITPAPDLTANQKQILLELGRPLLDSTSEVLTPATNQEIAESVFLSLDAVKGHLRVLFQKFGVADLPQNRKRHSLVDRAVSAGVISPADYGSRPTSPE